MEESRINPPAQVEMIALDNLYEKDDVKLKQNFSRAPRQMEERLAHDPEEFAMQRL